MELPGRVAFSIFGMEVMWYGILIAVGIICAFFVIYYRAPRYHGITRDRTFNLVILILVTALIGTRVYYVMFEWEYYGANPAEIFNVRAGGLAIHGGLIFGCLMAALLARIYKERFLNIVDVFFIGIPLGQAIGRWGNFFNSEAHGTHTDLPWAIIVDGDTVHPTFLYESIWCFILFIILWKVDNNRKFFGQTFFLYCILYSVERFFVEALRTDSLMVHFPWGEYRQAQVISLCAIVGAGLLYFFLNKWEKEHGGGRAINAVADDVKAKGSEVVGINTSEDEEEQDGDGSGDGSRDGSRDGSFEEHDGDGSCEEHDGDGSCEEAEE